MASTYINTLPAIVNTTIYQGVPWAGVQVGFEDQPSGPVTITVTASVATGTIAEEGAWLADCDISEADADGIVTVSLDATATAALPAREVLIDVLTLRTGIDTEPILVMRVHAQVESSLPAEPVGP